MSRTEITLTVEQHHTQVWLTCLQPQGEGQCFTVSSVQFKMVSVTIIIHPPCLSEVSPVMSLKQFQIYDLTGKMQHCGCWSQKWSQLHAFGIKEPLDKPRG